MRVESLTHLAIAPKIQEHFEMREGPGEVGNVIRLGGLEWSTPRVPVAASAFVAITSRFPFVSLWSPDKQSCHIFAKVDSVTLPNFYSYRYRYTCHLVRDVVGSCTCNTIVSVVVVTRKKNVKPETVRGPRVLIPVRIGDWYDIKVL